jgi:hypothetical protein
LYVLHDFGESLLIYMYSGLPLIAIIEGNIMLFFLLTGDVDILIIHLERTNEITEVLKLTSPPILV